MRRLLKYLPMRGIRLGKIDTVPSSDLCLDFHDLSPVWRIGHLPSGSRETAVVQLDQSVENGVGS